MPWTALVEWIAPFAPEGRLGRPPFPVGTLLHIHCMQQWFTLSDSAVEQAARCAAVSKVRGPTLLE